MKAVEVDFISLLSSFALARGELKAMKAVEVDFISLAY